MSSSADSPHPSGAVVLHAPTADDMKALGRRLGQAMRVGDVVGLVGTLGAGKTTLAQGIADGLQVAPNRHVASPTFALINEHPARVPFVHADLYRLSGEVELAELGLEEIFDRASTVIEWADLFPAALPADHLRITITAQAAGESRALSLHAGGPNAARLAAILAQPTVA
ncbi:MAG: tRNA (adenosine(37)-N6)-threonylcarbamoyltransferase complex ATPase subunit type 1 TsaE [Pseudomonadota bacterium]